MKQALLDIKPTVEAVFRHLHANPEISWKEFSTTEYLKDFLDSRRISSHYF